MNNNKRKCGKSYATEYEANNFANDLIMRYPDQETQITYKCDKCSQWHLCPENRHTPSQPCNYCRDSKGVSKQLYRDKSSVLKRKSIIKNERHKNLSIYECPHNPGKYHLSHNLCI